MFNAIVTQPDEYRNVGFESLTSDERAEYETWSDEAYKGIRPVEPIDLAFRVYDDLDIWEIPDYGRVAYRDRDDCWAHNGPKAIPPDWDDRYHSTRDGAMKALIQAVQAAQDAENARDAWKHDAPLGHYGGWR